MARSSTAKGSTDMDSTDEHFESVKGDFNLIDRALKLDGKDQAAAPEIWDMWLCESVSCSLHPGVLYRFRVDPTCEKCTAMERDHGHDARICPSACTARPPVTEER